MKEFKVWIQETPNKDGWWILKSASPNDDRPSRVLAEFSNKQDAEEHLHIIWSHLTA